jgi:flagellar basal-body rod modification protein FlgD
LLVTEMQNQDPTATTDPNEYINQLVSVNSLEQLININQTLTSGLGSSTSGTGGSSPSTQAASSGSASSSGLTGSGPAGQVQPAVAANQTNTAGLISQATSKLAPGNLSIPNANPAANRVAQALNGKTHTL